MSLTQGGPPIEQKWLDTLLKLLRLPTAPSREDAVADWLAAWAGRRNLPCRTDRWGNLLVEYARGSASGRPLALCAHMDHPGFVAEEMEGPRLLRARWHGGVPADLFEGAAVRFVAGQGWTTGRIAEAHRDANGQRISSVLAEVKRPVPAGSVGMWDFPGPRVRGNIVSARSHDDIAGVAAIVCAVDEAAARRTEGRFQALFTRCEEAGLLGAIGACKSRTLPKRSVAVALEASRALPAAPMGGGVVVRVGDRTSMFTPWVTHMLTEEALRLESEEEGFRWQRRLMDGGTCESSVYAAFGFDAGGLCLPLGNYHNVDWDRMKLGPERIDARDFFALVRLLAALIRRGATQSDPRTPWERSFREKGGLLMK